MTGSLKALSPVLSAAWLRVLGLSDNEVGDVPRGLASGVLSLGHRFTREHSLDAALYMDRDEIRRAYLAYYLPVNLAKVQSLLVEMPSPEIAPSACGPILRVLDVGCGPGTGALGVLDWAQSGPAHSNMALHVVAVDKSLQALRETSRFWEAYCSIARGPTATLSTVQSDIQRRGMKTDFGCQAYDLIIVANTLNELFRGRADSIAPRVALLRRLLELLNQHGTLMVIEPALRETSRALHLVRDAVVAAGECNVYSPCLHEQSCPALLRKTDWCHEERLWTPPQIVQTIDREVGFIKDSLKFSYLLLRKDGRTIVSRASGVYRVVSELRRMKGEQRAWLCHEQGRPEVGRLDRERSEDNSHFDDWHRGAIVRVEDLGPASNPASGGSLTRIRKTTTVELVRPVCGDPE